MATVGAERGRDPECGEEGQQLMMGKTLSTELVQEDLPSDAVLAPDAAATTDPSKHGDSAPVAGNTMETGADADKLEGQKDRQSEARQTINKLKNTAADTWSKVGSNAAKGGAWVWEASKSTAQATADGLKKLKIFGSPLDSICKQESTSRPIPRLVLVCCTAIVSGDLSTKGIFKEEGTVELVGAVTDHFYLGHGAVLPPSGASTHVLAGVLKQFLSNLQEPLLTYRLAPEWVVAGQEPIRGKLLAQQLPQPNANAFDLLLDTCHTIAAHSEENEMDARALAEALVPVLLWMPPQKNPPKNSAKPSQHGLMSRFFMGKDKQPKITEDEDYSVVHLSDAASPPNASPVPPNPEGASEGPTLYRIPLQGGELEAVVCVVTYLISEYRTM